MDTDAAKNASSTFTYMHDYFDSTFSIISTIVNDILSLPLNGCVMWLILRGANKYLASELLPLNLALSEILYSLLSFCFIAYTKQKLFVYFQVFVFSLECYVGVVHPGFYLRYKPLRYEVLFCCVCRLLTLGSCLYCNSTVDNTLYLYGFFNQNVIFLFVMLLCCLATIRALKDQGPGEKVPQRKKSNAMKRRALKIISLIMTTMTMNFLLCVAAVPLQCCISVLDFSRAITIGTRLALASGFVQPLLYLHRNGKLFSFNRF